MQESSKHNSLAVAAVVALVIGLLVGFGITKAMDSGDKNDLQKQVTTAQAPNTATKAADLRTTLVEAGLQHMALTDQAVDAALDKAPNAAQVGAALYSNGTDIGALVGSVYGKDAETTFNTVWKLHLDDFVKYAVADAGGDKAAADAALADIQTNYTKPLAAYLAKANPNLPEAALESGLGEHVNMTAQMIDDHVQGKYADEAAQLKMANDHITGLFSTLAGGIVKQYPSKF